MRYVVNWTLCLDDAQQTTVAVVAGGQLSIEVGPDTVHRSAMDLATDAAWHETDAMELDVRPNSILIVQLHEPETMLCIVQAAYDWIGSPVVGTWVPNS